MKVIGLDLSLTSTGVMWDDGVPVTYHPSIPKEATERDRIARLIRIRDFVLERAIGAGLAVIEGYSYGARVGGPQLGELGGVIKVALQEAGLMVLVVQPALLKTFAAGKGNASKEEVFASAIRRAPGYQFTTTDQADAFWLFAMGRHLQGVPFLELPKDHTRALDKLSLPEVVPA